VEATPDLAEHPPAVVNLLANRWRLDEDAAEATLLDLAARGHLEIRQPGDDPAHSTLHPREAPAAGEALLPFEWRVLDRVRRAAVGGVVPLPALTFRDPKEAAGWRRRFVSEVVAHARQLNLSRRRLGKGHVTLLTVAALVPSLAIALAIALSIVNSDDPDAASGWSAMIWATLILMCAFGGLAGRYPGERDTPDGRLAAARWLGVRRWLEGHDRFADLPPAAVVVWDRYLAYGAALGATHVASAAMDLGMGSRRLVWSSYGGHWHRVRVRYPAGRFRYGQRVADIVRRAVPAVLAGAGLLAAATWIARRPDRRMPDWGLDLVAPLWLVGAAAALGIVLVLAGTYAIARATVDYANPRQIEGEVLWVSVWRKTSGGEDRPAVPWLHHLAVDDGVADPARAWGLPSEWSGRARPGDVVRIRVHPWTRRVVALDALRSGPGYGLHGHATELSVDALVEATNGRRAAPYRRPDVVPTALLTVDEVGRALGMPVRTREIGPVNGMYVTANGGATVLMIQLMTGTLADLVWRLPKRGTELPGIGDGAFAHDTGGAARRGDAVVVLTLHRAGRDGAAQLPWLLARAAERLTSG
jgi:hypothetical protein